MDRFIGRPRLDRAFTEYFEIIWIQNAKEARWLLDAFDVLSVRAPHELLGIGFPPECLVFDYALTQGGNHPRPDTDRTYPVGKMQELLHKYHVEVAAKYPGELEGPPSTGTPRGKDRTGCYIGGEMARAFAAHPCGAVPTTAHMETEETDAAFYEWLNKRYFMDLFKDKSRTPPTWEKLLPPLVSCLRQRIVELAGAGIIRVDINTPQDMIRAPLSTTDRAIVFRSRFGRRDLPVHGLFIDQFVPDRDDDSFSAKATAWARDLLTAVFQGQGQGHGDFRAAKELAEQYWGLYMSEAMEDRYQLSGLAATFNRSAEQERELDVLCERIGVPADKVRRNPDDKVEWTKQGYVCKHLCKATDNSMAIRWAVLMLAVAMEQHYRLAGPEYRTFEATLGEDKKSVRLISENLVENLPEPAPLTRPLKNRRLVSWGWDDRVGMIERPIARLVELDDLLNVIDPLPQDLFTFFQKDKGHEGCRGKDITSLTQALKRLGKYDKSYWGSLGLSLSDVLENRPFDCELCAEALKNNDAPGDCHKTGSKYHHGIRRGEGLYLRMYADEIGFQESDWPNWLRNAP
jgi:hypothetical protein